MVTAAGIRAYFEGQIEDNRIHVAVLAFLRQNDGDKLTVRHTNTLTAKLGIDIRIDKQFGNTYIRWGSYSPKTEADGSGLRVATVETNVVIDADWIEADNVCYFAALEERNARRRELIADKSGSVSLAAVASAISDMQTARAKAVQILTHNHFGSDVYGLERMAGLRDK